MCDTFWPLYTVLTSTICRRCLQLDLLNVDTFLADTYANMWTLGYVSATHITEVINVVLNPIDHSMCQSIAVSRQMKS